MPIRFRLLFALILGGYAVLNAQQEVGCKQLYLDAKEAYKAGMIDMVPELLLPCMENGLEDNDKIEAYKLLISSYLFDYFPDKAAEQMDHFLRDFPDYNVQATDEAGFVQLLNKKRTLLVLQQEQQITEKDPEPVPEPVQVINEPDPEPDPASDEPEIDPEEAERQRLEQIRLEQIRHQQELAERERTRKNREPRRAARSGGTYSATAPLLGVSLGMNATLPQMLEPYSTGNPNLVESSYGMAAPGVSFGVFYGHPLSKRIELSGGLSLRRNNFSYSSTPFSFTSYSCTEHQMRLGVPLWVGLYLNEGSIRTYLKLGVEMDYLLSSSVTASRSYESSTFSGPEDVELEKADVKAARNSFNLMGNLALGVKLPLERTLVFVEVGYSAGFMMANDPDSRYQSGDLNWLIYHVDSDFRINQLSLMAGLAWKLNREGE